MDDRPTTISIRVNGEPRELAPGTSVADLVVAMGLLAGRYAVEIDTRIVPRSQHAERRLVDGETIEIVTFVGGG